MPRMPCRISDSYIQEPEDVHYPELEDEDAAYEQAAQRATDLAREEAALLHQNDEQLDCEAREVIKAERARLEVSVIDDEKVE